MPSGHCKLDTETNKPIQNSGSKRFSGDFGGGGGCKEQGGGGRGICPVPPRTPQETNLSSFCFFRKLRTPLKNLVRRTTDRAQLDWQRNSISVEIGFLSIERS